MLRIEKIASDGETLRIDYSQINSDNGEFESYSVKSKRTPAPEFFEDWNSLKNDLPTLMHIDALERNVELRRVVLKHSSVLSDQMEYKVQFLGSSYADGGTDYQFTTGIREGFWEARDENEEHEYVGTGEELSKEFTAKVNAVIDRTLDYIKGASAQQSLFPEDDATNGAIEEDESIE